MISVNSNTDIYPCFECPVSSVTLCRCALPVPCHPPSPTIPIIHWNLGPLPSIPKNHTPISLFLPSLHADVNIQSIHIKALTHNQSIAHMTKHLWKFIQKYSKQPSIHLRKIGRKTWKCNITFNIKIILISLQLISIKHENKI